jgi:hypothetical protein
MNNKSGIIALSMVLCSLAAPVQAEFSDAGDVPSAEVPGGRNAVYSLLDKYAPGGDAAMPSTLSDTSLFTAVTKSGSPMIAYYSLLGSDDQEVISSVSSASPYFNTSPALRQSETVEAAPPRAAAIGGNIVIGSGAVVSGESVAPLSGISSSPIVTDSDVTVIVQPAAPVPLPLPFLLFGSGLATLIAIRRRSVNC